MFKIAINSIDTITFDVPKLIDYNNNNSIQIQANNGIFYITLYCITANNNKIGIK